MYDELQPADESSQSASADKGSLMYVQEELINMKNVAQNVDDT